MIYYIISTFILGLLLCFILKTSALNPLLSIDGLYSLC